MAIFPTRNTLARLSVLHLCVNEYIHVCELHSAASSAQFYTINRIGDTPYTLEQKSFELSGSY